jgi:hypothetical protein
VAEHLSEDFTLGVEETEMAVFEAIFARGRIGQRAEFVGELIRGMWGEQGVVRFC